MVIIIFGILLLLLGILGATNQKSFINLEKSSNFMNIIISLATGLRDGNGIIVWVILATLYGFQSLWLWFGLWVGSIVVFLLIKKVWNQIAVNNTTEIHQIIEKNIGKLSAKYVQCIYFVSSILYASSQIFVGSAVVNYITGIGVLASSISVIMISMSYVWLKGFRGTLRTDILQFCGMALFTMGMLLLGMNNSQTLLKYTGSNNFSHIEIMSFVLLSALTMIGIGDVWQKLLNAKSFKDITTALSLFGPIYFLLSFGVVAFSIISVGNIENGESLLQILEALNANRSSIVLNLFIIFVLSSLTSTFDSQVYLSGKMLIDIFEIKYNIRRLMRWYYIILSVIFFGLGLYFQSVIEYLFGIISIVAIVAPIIILSIVYQIQNKKYDLLVCSSLIISSAVYVAIFVHDGFSTVLTSVLPSIASISLLLGISVYLKFKKL